MTKRRKGKKNQVQLEIQQSQATKEYRELSQYINWLIYV